jgi:hypothetical protein
MAAFFTASLGLAAEKTFKAKFSGKEETPAVSTKAKGDAEFKLGKDSKELTYIIHLKDIENVTAAHIHMGKKGKAGPPVVNLFTGLKKAGKFSGVLAEGRIMDKDLTGDLQGKMIDDLVMLIKSGDAYVNVHTDMNPNGEIRGQIK